MDAQTKRNRKHRKHRNSKHYQRVALPSIIQLKIRMNTLSNNKNNIMIIQLQLLVQCYIIVLFHNGFDHITY